jgi:hypothetical protein
VLVPLWAVSLSMTGVTQLVFTWRQVRRKVKVAGSVKQIDFSFLPATFLECGCNVANFPKIELHFFLEEQQIPTAQCLK